MAMEESKQNAQIQETEKSPSSKPEYQYRARPRYSIWNEDNKMIMEVILPGVPKDKIQIKGLKDYIMVHAVRETPLKDRKEMGKILYSLDLPLEWEIVPEKTIAKYSEGLLRVEMQLFNPLEQSHIIPINGTNPNGEQIIKDSEKAEVYVSFPEMSRDINYENRSVDIEICMPGTKQENILLRVPPDTLDLIANRGKMSYRANYNFGVEVIPEKTTATYADGLLKIHAIFRDRLDDAREIKL